MLLTSQKLDLKKNLLLNSSLSQNKLQSSVSRPSLEEVQVQDLLLFMIVLIQERSTIKRNFLKETNFGINQKEHQESKERKLREE
jgi:hypothetical protein